MKSNRTKDLLIRIAKAVAVPLIAWAIMQAIDMAFAGMGVINNAADVKTLFRNLISSLAFALAIGANLNCGRMDLSLGAQMYAGVIFGGNIALMFHLGGIGVLLLSLVVGGICGVVIGFVFIKLRILPMVLGLGMTLVFECVCFAINNQQGVILFGKPGVEILSNITFVIIVSAAIVLAAYYLFQLSSFGFKYRAIQGSQKLAADAGINIYSNCVLCYVIAGVLVISVIVAVCFLTNPKEEEEPLLQTVPDTVPTEAMEAAEEDYQPLSGYYAYTNGGLTLEIDKVSGVKTQTARDSSGEAYEQTILLTEPGIVVSIVDPDMNGEAENWRLCEATGSLAPIPIRDDLGSMRLALGANSYSLEDGEGRSVLILKRKAEKISFYQPATATDAEAYDLNDGKLLFSYQRFMKTPPGDLGKLALALVVLEDHDPQELVDTTNLPAYLSEPIYRQSFLLAQSGMQLERMEEMTVEDLLTMMLIRGGDDAAYALARFAAGSEEAMVAKMNAYVKYACMDTNYTDLYGYAEGQYTTGMDTISLVNRMLQNPCLSKIWETRDYTVRFPDNGEEYTGYTSNYLFDNRTIPEFYDVRVTGGFAYYRGTANAVCTARQNGKDVLFVILGAEREFMQNGWQLKRYGNFDEMGSLINTVFEAMDSYPVQFAD